MAWRPQSPFDNEPPPYSSARRPGGASAFEEAVDTLSRAGDSSEGGIDAWDSTKQALGLAGRAAEDVAGRLGWNAVKFGIDALTEPSGDELPALSPLGASSPIMDELLGRARAPEPEAEALLPQAPPQDPYAPYAGEDYAPRAQAPSTYDGYAQAPPLEEYDPFDLDFEFEAISKKLDLMMEEDIKAAEYLFDGMIGVYEGDPAIQASFAQGKQESIVMIKAEYRMGHADLLARFAGLKREASETHQQIQMDRRRSDLEDRRMSLDIAMLEDERWDQADRRRADLEDRRLGLEIAMMEDQRRAQAMAAPEAARPLSTQPDQYREVLGAFIEASPGAAGDEDVQRAAAAVSTLLDDYALGLLTEDADLLSSWQSPYSQVPELMMLLQELEPDVRVGFEQLLEEVYGGVLDDLTATAAQQG